MSLLSSSLLGRREGCGSEEACLNRDKSWAEACPTDRPDRGGKSVRIVLSQGGEKPCCMLHEKKGILKLRESKKHCIPYMTREQQVWHSLNLFSLGHAVKIFFSLVFTIGSAAEEGYKP